MKTAAGRSTLRRKQRCVPLSAVQKEAGVQQSGDERTPPPLCGKTSWKTMVAGADLVPTQGITPICP